MFSFIHTADIHLDSPLRGLNQRTDDAPVEKIRGATRRALENIVRLAIENEVQFVLIAGDLYDGDWPDYNTGLFFNKQMRRLDSANIPVYLITGNHDAASQITRSLKPPSNVTILSTTNPETIELENLPVAIHGQGFATQSVTENLASNYPTALPDRFNIGMLHTSLAGNPDHDSYAPCSIQDLTEKKYDYWALGHIHQHEILHKDPHIIYCGNPQGRHIKETDERGCYLIEVDDNLSINNTSFLTTDVVRWQSLKIDVSDLKDPDSIRESISQHISSAFYATNGRLLALRITLEGDSDLHNQLHADEAHWRAECVNIAAEIDEELIWLEQLRINTRPTYSREELMQRDTLTKLVLEALDDFDPGEIPNPVADLANRLRGINNDNLQALLSVEENKEELKSDVSAIVLRSISSSVHE